MEIIDRITAWLLGVIAVVVLVSLTGCRTTRYVPLETVRTSYQERVKTVHDTVRDTVLRHSFVFQKDSMTMSVRGDTFYVERWHTSTMGSLEKAVHVTGVVQGDSVTGMRSDTIRVPSPVERKAARWESAATKLRKIALSVLFCVAIAAGLWLWLRLLLRWMTSR